MAAPTQSPNSPDTGLVGALQKAIEDLEQRVRRGEGKSCESILRAYPEVAASKDSLLELIYTEYVLRQEMGQAAPIAEWIARFPQWKTDLEALFQVDAFVKQEEARDAETKWSSESPRYSAPGEAREKIGRVGRFELLEEIGFGGMGVVYRAHQLDLDRIVALKMITGTDALSSEVRRRFRAEAEAAAKLAHPHIVQIHEVGNDERQPYFSMEYVSGGNLENQIRRNPLAALPAARLAECLARTIHFAHGQGIIHRDLKPANILLSPSEQPDAIELRGGQHAVSYVPKITDFGLAKRMDAIQQQTATGAALGTPSYMAPEQASGDAAKATAATDVYALGAVLYDMLAGRPPFHAATIGETLEQVRKEDPVALRQLQPETPRDLETICMKCLQKDRARRYPSAGELADDLARFLAGRPILARRASAAEQLIKWTMRHPAKASLVAVVWLGVLGIAWQWRRAESHRASAETSTEEANRARTAETEERQRVQRTLYAHDLSLANYEYQSNQASRALQLLAGCPEKLRHWEWNFIDQTCKERAWQFDGFELATRGVAMSPDGSLAAACSGVWGTAQQGEIRVWDLKAGALKWSSRAHPGPVMDLQFDRTGQRIVSAGAMFGDRTKRGRVMVWDAQTGSPLWSLDNASSHTAIFTPNNEKVVIAHSNGFISVHCATTGGEERRWRGHPGNINDLSFWPDGKHFVTAGRDGFFRIWEFETGKNLKELKYSGDTRRAACSSDGRSLAVCAYNGKATLFDFQDDRLRELNEFHLGDRVGAFLFSPDGQYVITSGLNKSTRLIDPTNGRVHREFHGHNGDALDASTSQDGVWLVTGGQGGGVAIWNLAEERNEFRRLYVGPFLRDVEYSASGRYAAAAMAFNTNGARYDDQTVKLWDPVKKEFLPGFRGHTGWLTSVSIDPQERWVLSGSQDKTARLWSFPEGKPGPILYCASSVIEVAFADKGNTAVTAEAEGALRTWNSADGAAKASWQAPGNVTCLASHPQRFLIAASGESGVIWLWRKSGGEPLIWSDTKSAQIAQLIFSMDGHWLAAAREDASIDVWKVENVEKTPAAAPWATLRGHTRGVTGVDFSHDGKRLASCGSDRTLKLWDVESGHEVLSLPSVGLEGVRPRVAISPKGDSILHVDQMQVQTWSVLSERQCDLTAWHQSEAQTAQANGHWHAAALHYESLQKLQPQAPRHASQRGLALGHLEKWAEAEIAFQESLMAGPVPNNFDFQRLALLQLYQGKRAEHDQTCERYWTTYKETTNPTIANDLSWCLARSPTMPHVEDVVALAERAAGQKASAPVLNTLGAVYLRAGQAEKAMETLGKSMQVQGQGGAPQDWLLLALAYQKLGHAESSQMHFGKVREWMVEQERRKREREPLDSIDVWDVRMELEILMKEYESTPRQE